MIATTDLAASLAHEVNNPLCSVISSLYMAASSGPHTPEVKRYLEIAQQESERLARISKQILALHRQPDEVQAVDIRCLLQDVLATCRPQANHKQQQLKVELDWLGSVHGFGNELRQALLNVLQNAMEQAPAGGTIAIRAYRSHSFRQAAEQGVRILVANEYAAPVTGKTTPPSSPFPNARPQNGVGLGLWVARSVIWKHGGNVRIRSCGTGRNAIFCAIYLPARRPAASQAAP